MFGMKERKEDDPVHGKVLDFVLNMFLICNY